MNNSKKCDKVNKKAYSRPRVQLYGTLAHLTRSIGKDPTSKADGGSPNPQHVRTR